MALNTLKLLLPNLREDPLVALDYMVFTYNEYTYPFACGLCITDLDGKFKKGELNNMIIHFQSTKHRFNYFMLHFPTIHSRIQINKTKVDVSVMKDEFDNLVRLLCIEVCKNNPPSSDNVIKTTKTKFIRTRSEIQSKLCQKEQTYTEKDDMLLFNSMMTIIDQFEDYFKNTSITNEFEKEEEENGEKLSKQETMQSKKIEIKREKQSPVRQQNPMNLILHEINEFGKFYEEMNRKVKQKYESYRQQPDSHPFYEQEWQYYNFTIKRIDLSNPGDRDIWQNHWMRELTRHESIEALQAKIITRHMMKIPIDEEDARTLDKIEEDQKKKNKLVKELLRNEREKQLIMLNLGESSANNQKPDDREKHDDNFQKGFDEKHRDSLGKRRRESRYNDTIKEKASTSEKPKKPPTKIIDVDFDGMLETVRLKMAGTSKSTQSPPQATTSNYNARQDDFETIGVKEICALFDKRSLLDETTRNYLFAYLLKLKREDPNKYDKVLNTNLLDDDVQDLAIPKVKIKLEDDDDYDDSVLIKKIKRNIGVFDSDKSIIESKGQVPIIDLTLDDD